MIITVASFKGGVGKTTTAVHLAAYLNKKKPALLIDGDPNRSATKWNARGRLPFKVIDERQAARFARDFEHIVIDTEARPDEEDLRSLATGCDLLVIPTTPDAMALDALLLTVEALQKIGSDNYRILLTVAPPKPSRDAEEAIEMLTSKNLPIFKGYINRRVAFQKASLNGTIVAEVKDAKSEQAWREYEMVGKEIMKMQKGGQ
jgi:chromosome partitioning protein